MLVREKTPFRTLAGQLLSRSAPFYCLAGFMALLASPDDRPAARLASLSFGLAILAMALWSSAKIVLHALPVTFRDDRFLLLDRWPLSSRPPSAVLVRFDAHTVWNTYILAGTQRIFHSRHHLFKEDKAAAARLARDLGVPLLEQGFLGKPKRVRWKP